MALSGKKEHTGQKKPKQNKNNHLKFLVEIIFPPLHVKDFTISEILQVYFASIEWLLFFNTCTSMHAHI